LQLVGGPHSDDALLRIAVSAERVLGQPADILGAPPRLAGFDDGIRLRDTPADEIPAICAAEAGDAGRQIVPYSEEQHRQEWGKPAVVYKSVCRGDRFIGFVILVLDPDSRSVEFRRIVVTEPDRGIGTEVVQQVLDLCRGNLGRTRVWLDVFESNARARHVYEKAGFRPFSRSAHDERALVLYEYDTTDRP
jgi:RimJ/RimL family protein N-acetyltransferase